MYPKKHVRFTVLWLLAIAWCGCTHTVDPPTVTPSSCKEIPPSKSPLGYQTIKKGVQYETPAFISGSNQEYLMKKVTYGLNATTEIVKGVIGQSSQLVLYSLSGYVTGKPSPSNKYVVFCKQQGNQLWRINLNGDSVTKITNYPVPVYSPEYNKSVGSTDLCCLYNSGTVSNSFLLFLSDNGNAFDTVLYSDYGDFTWLHPSWSVTNKIAFSYYDQANIGVSVYDYSNKTVEQILLKKFVLAGDDIYSLCWHPNRKDIYFSNGFGIFKINTITKKQTLIKEGCSSQVYQSIDISSDGTKLLVQKINVVKISETRLEEYSHVCELEIDGLSERVLF